MTKFKHSKSDTLKSELDMISSVLTAGRLTTVERDSLTNLRVGSLIYNTTENTFQGLVSVDPEVWDDLNTPS